MEVRRPADREHLDIKRRFPEPCRVVGDEGERSETDLVALEQIPAGRHDEGEKMQPRRKSLRRLPHGGRQLSWERA